MIVFSGDKDMSEDIMINRAIIKEITVPAGIDEVWNAWPSMITPSSQTR